MKLTIEQKRVISQNPNIHSAKLAKLIDCHPKTIRRSRVSNWSYTGVGIPLLRFDGLYRVKYKHKFIFASISFNKSMEVLDHLIWCIDNGMFNKARIEHPYFYSLRFGE